MAAPTSTFDLLQRFRQGDSQAFTLLFEKYRRRLGVLIHYKLSEENRRRLEVDDILQETFFAAVRQLDRFEYRTPGSLLSWLSRIADHAIIDAARHESRKKRHGGEMLRFRSPSNPGGPEPADSKTPSRLYRGQEAIGELIDRLNQLPTDYRQVILLARVEGLSTAEMAERLGKTRPQVALLLHRALLRLGGRNVPG